MNIVYELRNSNGIAEYVGVANDLEIRLYQHTKIKGHANNGSGKFYGRNDLTIHCIQSFNTRKEALKFEGSLKIYHNMIWTEVENAKTNSKASRKLTLNEVKEIRILYIPRVMTTRKLAEIYGVSHGTIQGIISNKYYND